MATKSVYKLNLESSTLHYYNRVINVPNQVFKSQDNSCSPYSVLCASLQPSGNVLVFELEVHFPYAVAALDNFPASQQRIINTSFLLNTIFIR